MGKGAVKTMTTIGAVVACVMLLAFGLNVILPNTVAGVINALENGLRNATGVTIDINGDNKAGERTNRAVVNGANDTAVKGAKVGGFSKMQEENNGR